MNKKLKKGLTVSSAAAMGMSIVLPTVSVIAAPATTLNGWVKNAQGVYNYYNNGTMVKNGWAKDSKGWCFLSAVDGSWVQEGWAKDSTGWGYIQNGYWVVGKAMYAKDSQGWNFIGTNGYVDSTVAVTATNPVDDATAAVVKAEASKLAADVDAAKAAIAKINDAVSEKAALTTRLAGISTNFEVSSVTVVDATHIKVAFTGAVDEDTATDTGNYSFAGADDLEDLTLDKADVQEDGKTVLITLSDSDSDNYLNKESDSDYTVKITDVKNTAGKVVADYKTVLTLFDGVKPTLESVKLTTRDKIQLVFSEAVTGATTSNIEIKDADGSKVNLLSANVKVDGTGDDAKTIDIEGLGGEDEGDYTVYVDGVKDLAGNKIVATNKGFTLGEDNTDPDVKSVKAISDTSIRVTFDEPIDAPFKVYVDGDEITLAAADIEAVSGTNKQSFNVDLGKDFNDGDSHKVKIDGYSDFAGNDGDSYTKYVSFDDTVGPALSSTEATIKTYGGDKYAVFTFDEDVDGNVDLAKNVDDVDLDAYYTDEDGDQVDATIGSGKVKDSVALDELEDNQFAINLSGLEIGDYTVTLPKGFATVNDAKSAKVDVTFSLKTKDESDVYVDGFAKSANDNDVYYVHFSDKVGASALDASNYSLDGDNVFGSAKFTSTDKDEVKLTVDQGAIDNGDGGLTSSSYEFTTQDIKDEDGNDVDDFNSNDKFTGSLTTDKDEVTYKLVGVTNFDGINFTDTTGPDVDSVKLVDLDTIIVTFDEAADVDANGKYAKDKVDEDDFAVKVDGENVDIDSAVSTDGKTYTLTLEKDIDSDYDTVKAGTSSAFDGEDALGNDGIAGSMQTAETDDDAPAAPTVAAAIKAGDTTVSGTAEAGSTVTVKVNGTAYTAVKAAANGSYSVAVTALAKGDVVSVTAADASDNVSDKTTVTVADKTAPATPVINPAVATDTTVSGTAEVGSTVKVKVGAASYEAVVAANGTYSVTLATALVKGDTVTVTATDSSDNTSAAATLTIQ